MEKIRHMKTHPSMWIAGFVAFIGMVQALLTFPRLEGILGILAAICSIAIIIKGAREAARVQAEIKAAHDLVNFANSHTPEERLKATLRAHIPQFAFAFFAKSLVKRIARVECG